MNYDMIDIVIILNLANLSRLFLAKARYIYSYINSNILNPKQKLNRVDT